MSLGTVLLILLILCLVGALPVWPHAQTWGYAPASSFGLAIVIILVVLLVTGRL